MQWRKRGERCAGCLDKCISLDATRNELISLLLRKITKYCHVCCFLEYCRAKARGEGEEEWEREGMFGGREPATNAKENINF